MAGENILQLVNITKEYDSTQILKNINLYIRKNEFVTLLGPSGCGKTTTLRILGGFEAPTSGTLLFDGKNINDLPPYKRNVNTVFQKYALFSHMNIFENIAFGLRIKRLESKVIREKVGKMLELVNLSGYEKRKVDSLSGGQQQRVAIARALVNEPEVLLLDEPLGALDLKLRKEMQIELKNMQKQLGITFVFVTHDQEEALSMSDTIVVMRDGEIQQIGTPEQIYNEPKNAYVADFIGESNILEATMLSDSQVEMAGKSFDCEQRAFRTDEKVDVVIRPEDIEMVSEPDGMIGGVVESITFKGVHYEVVVDCGSYAFLVHSIKTDPVGARVGLKISPSDIHIMKKESQPV